MPNPNDLPAQGCQSTTVPSPTRRNDWGVELTPVPVEIYLTIFDEIQPGTTSKFNETHYKETLASLSLTCKLFRQVCQPRMFRHLRFYGQNAYSQETTSSIQIVGRRRWREALAAGDPRCLALSSYVEACSLICWTSFDKLWAPVKQEPYTQLLHRNMTSLTSLPRLTQIRLEDCVVTAHVLDALARIPQLVSVDLSACVMATDYPTTNYVDVPRKGWTALHVCGASHNSLKAHTGNRSLFNDRLTKLVDPTQLRYLATDHRSASLVARMFGQGGVSPAQLKLLQVPIHCVDTQILLDILPTARHLKELRLGHSVSESNTESHIQFTVQLSCRTQGASLSCIVDVVDERHFESLPAIRKVFSAWSPADPSGLHFSFTMDLSSKVNLTAVGTAVFPLMLQLFSRCKDLYNSSTQYSSYAFVDKLTFAVIDKSPDASMRNFDRETLSRLDLHSLVDAQMNETFPALDHIATEGVLRPMELRRTRVDRVWRSAQ